VARPRRRTRPTLSLFPFLSVLACIIGTLTLLITATAIGEMAGETLDVERYEALEREIEDGRRRLAALRALREEVGELEAGVAEARETRAALEAELARREDAVAAAAPLREQLARARERQSTLEAELAQVEAEQEGLEARLQERREALARAPILIEPSGSGTGLEPHFAECRDDRVVFYEGAELRPAPVPSSRLDTSPDARRFLRRVRIGRDATAILLVRPGGIAACRALERQAALLGVRHGRLPLPADGELDFSRMREGGR